MIPLSTSLWLRKLSLTVMAAINFIQTGVYDLPLNGDCSRVCPSSRWPIPHLRVRDENFLTLATYFPYIQEYIFLYQARFCFVIPFNSIDRYRFRITYLVNTCNIDRNFVSRSFVNATVSASSCFSSYKPVSTTFNSPSSSFSPRLLHSLYMLLSSFFSPN